VPKDSPRAAARRASAPVDPDDDTALFERTAWTPAVGPEPHIRWLWRDWGGAALAWGVAGAIVLAMVACVLLTARRVSPRAPDLRGSARSL
jgi:hypothetical protein